MSPRLSCRLIVEGETFAIKNVPKLQDTGLTCWEEISQEETEKLFLNGPSFLWGCISAWELRGEKLYLTHLSGLCRMLTDEPQFARSYWGNFVIPEGNIITRRYVGRVWERDLHLHFENGLLVGTTMYYNTPEPENPSRRVERIAGKNSPRTRLGRMMFHLRRKWQHSAR